MTTKVLRIDASARTQNSVSRDLADHAVSLIPDAEVTSRDIGQGLPHINETWVGATFTPPESRTEAQSEALALSDEILQEVQDADTIVISTPIYNFNIPSTLKAWIDQIGRAGVAFKYTENGPVGLLEDKRVVIALASGGTDIGSNVDFATDYLRFIFGFVGIKDVHFVLAKGDDNAEAHETLASLLGDRIAA
ncbi:MULTISPECIES: FMN-dependent NADH-azoreductase [Halocynthiibacter]|uniref:FMN dependent NADH:quinone oxidoreductase n=1 Tax=Halocynthiibacter halioticoli TaxID=2986804 RepID=A0AAE3LRD2_9RHOB|nr:MULTISPECIES: NAD(P)H-dependent oxidoreductase [Halocynthiibacter]MCV6825447.1 NAD(P)H-dependent oxidoreductase [Halocynthiibacter halioticoli]MCW4058448.1 NAD(P)H-dependent oxidoreductase [Halocynthiibacter sp. SDUM655004]